MFTTTRRIIYNMLMCIHKYIKVFLDYQVSLEFQWFLCIFIGNKIVNTMENKKQFADNKARSAKIKTKMVEGYGKPVVVFAYFSTMAEAKQALNATNAMIYKGAKRKGTTRGFRVITGNGVSKAIRLVSELNDLV